MKIIALSSSDAVAAQVEAAATISSSCKGVKITWRMVQKETAGIITAAIIKHGGARQRLADREAMMDQTMRTY